MQLHHVLLGRQYSHILISIGLFLLYITGSTLHATHNLAGQIVAERVNGNTYRLTLTTYTDPAPAGVDRCSADLEIWNCASPAQKTSDIEDIPRSNGPVAIGNPDCPTGATIGVEVYGTVKENIYTTTYTFPGPGCYQIRYFDPNRREDILNIGDPGSQTFYLETGVEIPNPILGINNSPQLLNRPIDEACVGKLWTHNPGGFDQDGDSLSYSLLASLQYDPDRGVTTPRPVQNFRFPDDNGFGSSDFNIDSRTGLITWNSPTQIGVFNVAFRVDEFRQGVRLGYVIRDMVIVVKRCDNNPPIIESPRDTCIAAGEELRIPFVVYDPDFLDSVYLELNNGGVANGPFNPAIANRATILGQLVDVDGPDDRNFNSLPQGTLNGANTIDTIKGNIIWATDCDNIRSSFYQVDLYAHDNFGYFSNPAMLSAHHVVTVTVKPPRPTNLKVTKGFGEINISWDPAACPNVVGYNVYRSTTGGKLSDDSICCDVSPQNLDFELIAYKEADEARSLTDNLEGVEDFSGNEICYVITALFEDDDDGFDPNIESCGIEACVEIENPPIYLTNNSVEITDDVNGEIFIAWSKLDSIDPFFQGPFSYRLYRANNNQFPAIPLVEGLNWTVDTTYNDVMLDTRQRAYNYRIELVNGNNNVIFTTSTKNRGSSIFLTTRGGNGDIDLEWTEYVPWRNSTYEIYRSENGGPFSLLTTVAGTGGNVHVYTDSGLDQNVEYCYYIQSEGSHNEPGIKDPLFNKSQEVCDFARDDQPPCNPEAQASGDCEQQDHTVTISKPGDGCADDTELITVYFAPRPEGPFDAVATVPYSSFGQDTTLRFPVNTSASTFAGCYAVAASDRFGNTAPISEPVCIDFCPLLEMPNIFTPNNDGINETLRPRTYRDVRLVRIQIYDRWGKEVHDTNVEISNLWDGTVGNTGREAAEGTYYYVIQYDELGLSGNTRKVLKGYVVLMR
ncbi:MAG: gliding motility-associated C-terminal domain-containing protein [Bacteroidia bacterium]